MIDVCAGVAGLVLLAAIFFGEIVPAVGRWLMGGSEE